MRALAFVVLVGCGFRASTEANEIDGGPEPDSAGAPGDAPSGDAASACPTDYDVTLAGSTSRYRVIVDDGSFATHHETCNQDRAGATHLASIESVAEAEALKAQLTTQRPPASSNKYYLGAVQRRDQPSTTNGWLVFTGGDLPQNLWSSGQPNDDGAGENNQENLATITSTDLLNDATGDLAYGAVCECDGLAVAAAVIAELP